MPWIQNVSLKDVKTGFHKKSANTMLIQIVDPAMEFPDPEFVFKERVQFEFLDLEEKDNFAEEFKITPKQAQELCETLIYALEKDYDVVVHCIAGVCRSGAVVDVGTILGFEDTGAYRAPNLMVKKLMLNYLGLGYEDRK